MNRIGGPLTPSNRQYVRRFLFCSLNVALEVIVYNSNIIVASRNPHAIHYNRHYEPFDVLVAIFSRLQSKKNTWYVNEIVLS